jgi:hypothetical protein
LMVAILDGVQVSTPRLESLKSDLHVSFWAFTVCSSDEIKLLPYIHHPIWQIQMEWSLSLGQNDLSKNLIFLHDFLDAWFYN